MRARWVAWMVCAACAARVAIADEPAYFRHDRGVAADDARPLPDELNKDKALWRTELPPGHSTPIIAGDRIFLTGHDDTGLLTICLDRTSGMQLWRQAIGVETLEKFHPEGSPAAASVAVQNGRVFAFFGSFGLVCYDLDGKPLWSRKLGPFRDEFGSASSPILADGKVILCEDHDLDSYLLAVSQETGETVWQTPREGFTRSYATPVVWNVNGKPQLVVAGSLQLVAYDLADGRQLWARDGFARIVNTSPTIADGKLFVATWSPGGDSDARIAMEPWDVALGMWDADKDGKLQNAEMPAGEVRSRFFRIDLDGSNSLEQGEWEKYAEIFEKAQNTLVALEPGEDGQAPKIAWEYGRGLPYVASPLIYRGNVVLVKDGGVVTVLDATTGKLKKQARSRGEGNYYASPVAGDGKFYVASGGGTVTVFHVEPSLAIGDSFDFSERIAATPVIDGNRLLVRTAAALYAFEAE